MTWATPAAITYGTQLSGTQLNATASVAGSFVYTPTAGTVLSAGSQTLSVTFTPTDTTDYTTTTATVILTVNKATPTITWANPADIIFGTALSSAQLNATASVAGSFVYTPAAGTVLNAGLGQTLSVTFTPSDTIDYTSASMNVTINVLKPPVSIAVTPSTAVIAVGKAQQFGATGTASDNSTENLTNLVTWTSSDGSTAMITSGGLAVGVNTGGPLTITATLGSISGTASLTVDIAPSISLQPASQAANAGQMVTFTVAATGTAPLSYQWQKNGVNIVGATSASYTTPAITYGDNGALFTAVVSNVVGSATSTAAKLILHPALPTLPQATVDLTMPTQTGTIWNVPAGDLNTLQNDVNSATCGDTIVVAAGSTYTGKLDIPNKACTGWIIIESSQVSSLPSGTRVGPSNTANMATISSNVATVSPIRFQSGAHNWRLIGLEVTTTIGTFQDSLIETDVGATSVAQLPSFIIVDRCYVHADPTASVRRGVSFQVVSGAVVDSYISEIHESGADSQAIAVWNGPGPFLVQNNFLSAASENMLVGGVDPGIANLVPSDITIVGNHFWKNYAAWKGAGLTVKNLLELKNVQRVLVDSNVLEYSWGDAQVGFAVLLTPRNQGGTCNWCVVQDVTITHNLIQHAGSGIETAASDNINPSLPTSRVLIQNNVLTDISTNYGGDGRAFETLSAVNSSILTTENDLTIDHNTAFADHILLYLGDSGTIPDYQFTNNLGNYGQYGIFGNNQGSGLPALNFYVPNAIYNDTLLLTSSGGTDGGQWPSGTLWDNIAGAQFTNYSGGNYQLLSTSPYHNLGTDGKDIGVWDWTTFNNKTSKALTGIYP
jgi:hypothetical protein